MTLLVRLATLSATLLVASALVFLVMAVLPGDPAQLMLGIGADPSALAALRADMDLDRPLAVRFIRWLGGVITGDFGTSATYAVPVSTLIVERAAVSVPLAALGVLLSVATALPAGLAAATGRGRLADRTVAAAAVIALSLPNVWLGLLLVWLFAVTLQIAPAGGFPGWDAGPVSAIGALILPAIALAAPQAAILTRTVRSAVVEAMDEDYVALARAKGRSLAGAVLRHALPNAAAPIVTVIGLQFGFLVAGAIVVETVFSLPGLGRLLFQAVSQRDIAVVEAVVMVVVATVVIVNATCDAVAAALDPRQHRS